ncbi:MAG: hypothetical protein GWN14_09330 [candidate division Zixibacteria bacterium]|nr:hypothetical protein [candidate division Zixibacteria bacterium]
MIGKTISHYEILVSSARVASPRIGILQTKKESYTMIGNLISHYKIWEELGRGGTPRPGAPQK